jgi:hypothetical protein
MNVVNEQAWCFAPKGKHDLISKIVKLKAYFLVLLHDLSKNDNSLIS